MHRMVYGSGNLASRTPAPKEFDSSQFVSKIDLTELININLLIPPALSPTKSLLVEDILDHCQPCTVIEY